MMRKITIHQSDSNDIEVHDESDETIDQYCSELAELMKMGNVVILKTSTAQVVLRPSKVIGIKVEEGISLPVVTPPIPHLEDSHITEPVEDIITDVDP